MNHGAIRYEKTIDLKFLLLRVLKHWRVLVIVAVALALLLGGAELVSGLRAGQVPVYSAEELASAQKKIDECEALIADQELLRQQNRVDIADAQAKLERYSEDRAIALQVDEADSAMIFNLVEIASQINDAEETIAACEKKELAIAKEIRAQQDEIDYQQNKFTKMKDSGVSLSAVAVRTVLGGVLGVLIVCVGVLLGWFFDGRLQNKQELGTQFGLVVLGSIGKQPQKSGKIDRWVAKLAGPEEQTDEQREFDLLAAKLQVLAGGQERLLITGTVGEEILAAVSHELEARLPENGPVLTVAANLPANSEAIPLLRGSAVLVIEQPGKTRIEPLTRLVELLCLSDAYVTGAFTV